MGDEQETYLDMVRRHFGDDITEDAATRLLWDATAWPVCGPEYLEKQLAEMAERSGRDVGEAVTLAYQDLDGAMTNFNNRNGDG